MRKITLLSFFVLFFAFSTQATTWKPVRLECPLCHQVSSYHAITSYGGYIYSWPSKYQFIFWPFIDEKYIYSCPHCLYSSFAYDFTKAIPKDKAAEIRDFLDILSVEEMKANNYLDIPVTMRLQIAGIIYKIRGKDDEFWCHYYRVCAYHNDNAENKYHEISTNYRIKAIRKAQSMMQMSRYSGTQKELLVIIATLYNYIDQKDSALISLENAKSMRINVKDRSEEDNLSANNYLDTLIVQLDDFIRMNWKDSIASWR